MLGIGCMATARRFEDLEAWQLASELTDTVFRLTENGRAATDFEFCDQIREAAQNTPPLIAEGFVRYTPDEFVRYLRMARGELAEVQSGLLHAARRKYFAADGQAAVSALADRAMKTTTALLKSKLPFLKRRTEGRRKKRSGRKSG